MNLSLWRTLSLRWKLMLPFLVLLVAVGTLGTYVLVRDQATRAQTSLDADLSQRALLVRSVARDRELYLAESAAFAANIEGMAEAIKRSDTAAAGNLLYSVLALKPDLVLTAVTGPDGRAIAQYSRAQAGAAISTDAPASLAGVDAVRLALESHRTEAALGGFSGRQAVILAEPICALSGPCTPVGYSVIGIDARGLFTDAQGRSAVGSDAALALYDGSGRPLVTVPSSKPPRLENTKARRVVSGSGSSQVATLYTPYVLAGRRAGTIGVALPTAPAYGAVRAATAQLILLILVAVAGSVIIGVVLTDYILRRLSTVLETNQRIEAGDLTARARVSGEDEIGRLAQGVNAMAQSLQDSYATLEARVDERTADVRRLLEERTEFFTALSHEFRTPLAVIRAHADMLSSDEFTKTEAWNHRAGDSIGAASGQLLAFVNDILDLSRAERGALDLRLEAVDMAALGRELQPDWETLASTSKLELVITAPDALPDIPADRGRVRQVLTNLVDNAIKYTPPGGRVEVSLAAVNGGVEVRVTDSGVGIPAGELERIFEPFYRVKTTQPQNGQPSSGVGLALVRQIVTAHGGAISAKSGGRGTTFVLTLSGGVDNKPKRSAGRRRREEMATA